MAQLEVLNSEQHRSLRLRSDAAPSPHFVPIVASEFPAAAACCPIFLAKNPDNGRFYAAAMFGFEPGENLIEVSTGSSPFRPLNLERSAFFASGENIAVDVSDARLSRDVGQPIFDEAGEPTEAMRRIQAAIGLLVSGEEGTQTFLRKMVELRLVEPIDISLKFDDGKDLHLEGLYTISLDAIAELDDATALSLFRQGYLQLAYCIAGSLRQIPVLAGRRNARLVDGPRG